MRDKPIDSLEAAMKGLRDLYDRREAARLAARRGPRGSYRPAPQRNRAIAELALVREPIPGDRRGAERWITYSAAREEFLEIRNHPKLAELSRTVGLCDPDALNGYVAFPRRTAPRLPPGTGSLLKFIPVHGGISYAAKDGYMAVWGFDTMHFRSENEPRTDRDWMRAQCGMLHRGLLLAETLWPEFKRATNERRAELAQQLLDLLPEQPLLERIGFEGLLSLLTGEVG
jgi:hypothetical protein